MIVRHDMMTDHGKVLECIWQWGSLVDDVTDDGLDEDSWVIGSQQGRLKLCYT